MSLKFWHFRVWFAKNPKNKLIRPRLFFVRTCPCYSDVYTYWDSNLGPCQHCCRIHLQPSLTHSLSLSAPLRGLRTPLGELRATIAPPGLASEFVVIHVCADFRHLTGVIHLYPAPTWVVGRRKNCLDESKLEKNQASPGLQTSQRLHTRTFHTQLF